MDADIAPVFSLVYTRELFEQITGGKGPIDRMPCFAFFCSITLAR